MANIRDLEGVKRGSDIYTVDPRVLVLDYEWNCREDYGDLQQLKEFIRENGVPGLIKGFKRGSQLIVTDGYRRLTATNELIAEGFDIQGVSFQLEKSKNEQDHILTQIVSNSSKNFTDLEQGKVYKRWLSYGGSEEDLSKKLGISVQTIRNKIALSETAPQIHEMIQSGTVAASTAIQVVNATDTSSQAVEILSEAIEQSEGKVTGEVVEGILQEKGLKKVRKPNLKKHVQEMIIGATYVIEGDKVSVDFSIEEWELLRSMLGVE